MPEIIPFAKRLQQNKLPLLHSPGNTTVGSVTVGVFFAVFSKME